MLTIYGCGGGGGGAAVATTTSTTVTPSLGKFSPGTVVNLAKPDGTLLTTGSIGSNGAVTLSYSAAYTGPVVVTVVGAAGVTYFDEGTGADTPFGAGSTLQAVVPAPQTQVGVTALTNAAVANLVAAGGISSATALTVSDANAKVAAVFGLTDILVAPNPVSATTVNTLDLALPADKYALVLAAFAKSAPTGTTAATLAANLAIDLKDGTLNGQNGTVLIPAYALTPATLAAAYQSAATTLATPGSQTLAANTPLVVTPDVTKVVAVTNQSDVTLAKAMFAELRTTLKSFANGSKTGFLDSQATRINADLNANVAPEMTKVANRIGALSGTMTAYEDLTAAGNPGFSSGQVLTSVAAKTALVTEHGSIQDVWNGVGSYVNCWQGDINGVQTTGKVTCARAGSDNADYANNRIKMMVFELTAGATANQYTYTATRYNMKHVSGQTAPSVISIATGSTPGNGSVGKTVVSGKVTGIALNGTLPASTDFTGIDTIAISAARTALTAANNFHYALSGSVSTANLLDAAKVVAVSFDSGSFFDADETNEATTGSKVLAAKLIGTAKTAASQFTGTLDVGSFATDKSGKDYSPTNITFAGSISDTSTGGAGEFLTGKLEATVANYSQFDTTLPDSSTNYVHATLTFTGTIQAPSRPLMKLVLAVAKTSPSTSNVTLNYTYGTVKITGSGKVDGDNPANETLTLSNQDGVQVVTKTGAVTKAGAPVATLVNGAINYVDGVTESLI